MEENTSKIFGRNLRDLLEKNGKTQADLVRYIHVSSATVSDWTNGKKIPRPDKLLAICRWLDCELSDLLGKENQEPSNSIYMQKQNTKNIFRRRLQVLRTQKNLTQRKLGAELGMSKSAIGMYESGRREPEYEVILKIAEYFDVSTDYLLGASEYMILNQYNNGKKSAEHQAQLDLIQRVADCICADPGYAEFFMTGISIKPDDLARATKILKVLLEEKGDS